MIVGLVFLGQGQAAANRSRQRAEQRRADRREHDAAVRMRNDLSDEDRVLLKSIDWQLSAQHAIASARDCPECGGPFQIVKLGDMEIDCCRICKGCWFDPGELRFITGLAKDVPSDNQPNRPSRYACPVCGERMTESVFLKPHNLLVDRCPRGHGVYLEDRELERVLKIV